MVQSSLVFGVALACAASSACRDWPDPEIRSVTPAQMVATEATAIEVDAYLPISATVDYGEATANVDARAVLTLGGVALGDGAWPRDGLFAVQVPTVFAPGNHELRVTLGDGRTASFPGGFTVTEGQWPDGYVIDPITEVERFVPFTVTVRAQGPNAATFRGNVQFEVPRGASVGPTISAPFVDGVLTQTVTLNTTRASEVLIVTDVAGHRVTSTSFAVR